MDEKKLEVMKMVVSGEKSIAWAAAKLKRSAKQTGTDFPAFHKPPPHQLKQGLSPFSHKPSPHQKQTGTDLPLPATSPPRPPTAPLNKKKSPHFRSDFSA